MGNNISQAIVYFLVFAGVVIAGVVLYRASTRARMRRVLRRQWGEPADRSYTANERTLIRGQAAFLCGEGGFAIDGITAGDLDLDRLYARVNTTLTDAGDHMLYAMLRNPAMSADELQRRERNLRWAATDEPGREKVKQALYRLGRTGNVSLPSLFSEGWFSRQRWLGCVALSASLVLCIVLMLFGVWGAALPAVVLAAVNSMIAFRSGSLVGSYITVAQTAPAVLLAARRIADAEAAGLEDDSKRIRELLGRVKGVLGSGLMTYYGGFNDPTNPLTLFKYLFLAELIGFYHLARSIARHREEILELYRIVGSVDALIAAASWRESLPAWCVPQLDAGATGIEFADLAHPLLSDPVTNSAELRRNLLLTGSNATGKSTFLKTIALNAILAQTLHTCTAGAWHSGFYRVYTSMALRDDLMQGESYFITEIKSLKRMLDSTGGEIPSLCIVDEVLRGTNTGERIAAASEALLQFREGLCLAATHDIELTYILEGVYENMHFTETVTEDSISFDYKLRPGRSRSRNAIRLLGLLGYGKALVDAASARLERFEQTGQWGRGEQA